MTGYNSVNVAIGGEGVNQRSVLPLHFMLNGQKSAFNPLLIIPLFLILLMHF